ncbi:hypothetical protein D3C75_1294910 [compost metagenome]
MRIAMRDIDDIVIQFIDSPRIGIGSQQRNIINQPFRVPALDDNNVRRLTLNLNDGRHEVMNFPLDSSGSFKLD